MIKKNPEHDIVVQVWRNPEREVGILPDKLCDRVGQLALNTGINLQLKGLYLWFQVVLYSQFKGTVLVISSGPLFIV